MTRPLKDHLPPTVHREEQGLALAQLAAADLIRLPERASPEPRVQEPAEAGAKPSSTMVIEDRR